MPTSTVPDMVIGEPSSVDTPSRSTGAGESSSRVISSGVTVITGGVTSGPTVTV